MRAIVIFFVVINGLFFVWQTGGYSSSRSLTPSELTAIPSNINKLVLLSERNNKKPGESKSTGKKDKLKTASLPSQTRSAKKYVCFALGPFKEEKQTTSIALKLRELGAITDRRMREKQVPSGYWVYLPSFSSWKEARQKVMALEKKKMKDMFIMGRGAMKNAVSVGLFSSERAARKQVSRLVDLGEDPQLQTQYATKSEYWIDIDVEKGEKRVVSAIETIAGSLTRLELAPRKCKK